MFAYLKFKHRGLTVVFFVVTRFVRTNMMNKARSTKHTTPRGEEVCPLSNLFRSRDSFWKSVTLVARTTNCRLQPARVLAGDHHRTARRRFGTPAPVSLVPFVKRELQGGEAQFLGTHCASHPTFSALHSVGDNHHLGAFQKGNANHNTGGEHALFFCL